MRRSYILFLFLFITFNSCSLIEGDSTDDTIAGGTSEPLGKEIAEAKDFFCEQGAQFKFRVFALNGDLNYRLEMYIRKLFENKSEMVRIAADVVFLKN